MNERPHTWHYGLMARWWAEFNVATAEEVAYYRGVIEDSGEPALDLACGAGRLLLPLLRAGLTVDGCDISPDMLAYCRAAAEHEGFAPHLSVQAMHDLDLPRTYRTIVICDSFGLGGRRSWDLEALRRCHRHLAPGGTLVVNHYLPYGHAAQWAYWRPDRRTDLPEPWPERGDRRRFADGDKIELRSRVVDLDPLEQRLTLQMQAVLRHEGRVTAEEEYALHESLYLCRELLALLAEAGFTGVTVSGGYTHQPLSPQDTMIVVVARRRRVPHHGAVRAAW